MCKRLVFGPGTVRRLPELVRSVGGEAAHIVTDKGLVAAGVCARVEEALRAAGIAVSVYDEVLPDPSIDVARACGARVRESGAACVVGLGGGSPIDIAKVSAVLAAGTGTVADIVGVDRIAQAGLPVVAVPTTAGTGSETTPIAVLSDTQAQLKKGIVSSHLYPAVALVDPELAAGLPSRVTAYTGMDALTHAIEAYTNRHAHPFVNTFALEAVRLIHGSLRTAVEHGSDIEARTHMALGSLYGGMCLGPVNTAAVHALAYPLGGMFSVPHGVANSLLLPYVMSFNITGNEEAYARVAPALGVAIDGMSRTDAAWAGVVAVKKLAADTGIVTRMRDLGIAREAIPEMAERAMQVTRLLGNNPRDVTLDDVGSIYEEAY